MFAPATSPTTDTLDRKATDYKHAVHGQRRASRPFLWACCPARLYSVVFYLSITLLTGTTRDIIFWGEHNSTAYRTRANLI